MGMLRAHTIWKAMVEVLVSIALINWLKIIALQPLDARMCSHG